jgi:hypothetical protein
VAVCDPIEPFPDGMDGRTIAAGYTGSPIALTHELQVGAVKVQVRHPRLQFGGGVDTGLRGHDEGGNGRVTMTSAIYETRTDIWDVKIR